MPVHDPNRKPFPRGAILDQINWATSGHVHPVVRTANEAAYASVNPKGFQHDLGAQDAFLDHFGVLVCDQFDSAHQYFRYTHALRRLMMDWMQTKECIVPHSPWWGENYNSRSRRANAGEPRSLLRFLIDGDLGMSGKIANIGDNRRFPQNWSDRAFLPDDWDWNEDFWPVHPPDGIEVNTEGVLLPDGWTVPTWPPRILHPKESTPDLPLRVVAGDELRPYRAFVRDQGMSPTCVAHAVCAAMEVSLWRAGRIARPERIFSPAWLHIRTGDDPQRGRTLQRVIDDLCEVMPCDEKLFPLAHVAFDTWNTPDRIASSERNEKTHGIPRIQFLKTDDISGLKQHLAAGWVVVLTTAMHDDVRGRGLMEYGLPLNPVPDGTAADGGHAWLLIGYDHVDGQAQWKYEGRFTAMNSWGHSFPKTPVLEPGVCTLPFSYVLNYGLEAFAVRY